MSAPSDWAGNGKCRTVVIKPSEHPCPACGRTDRWEAAYATPGRTDRITMWCDCGLGEIAFVVEEHT